MYCYRYSAIHHAFIRIRNRFVRFKTSLKIYFICLSDKNTTRKKKQPSNTVRGGVSISRELRRSRNYFEQAAKKQDLSYTRSSIGILPREGRRRIFDLEGRWKSTSLGIRPYGNWKRGRVSRIYFVSFHKAKRGNTGIRPPIWRGCTFH